jgi:hypothetical protein
MSGRDVVATCLNRRATRKAAPEFFPGAASSLASGMALRHNPVGRFTRVILRGLDLQPQGFLPNLCGRHPRSRDNRSFTQGEFHEIALVACGRVTRQRIAQNSAALRFLGDPVNVGRSLRNVPLCDSERYED